MTFMSVYTDFLFTLYLKIGLFRYFCLNLGQYGIHLKYDDQHIPNSPFKVSVAPDSGTARNVTVHALKDRGLAVSNLKSSM